MKLFLASGLLLAFVSNFAGATQPPDKESLIFTSSPHPCMNGCIKDDKSTRFQNIAEQYNWINNYKPDGQPVVGVVVNGNLTESGATNDWMKIDKLFSTLKVPYLLGLGGNDYILNKESCPACAVRGVWFFNRHIVEKMMLDKNKNSVYANIGNVYFDFLQTITGKTNLLKETHGVGRLGYTVELGANKNIYLIQLNGHVGANVKANKFNLEGKDRDFDISYDYFHINPVVDWLEDRLEYAAQYQLTHSGAAPKTIVVTMNGDSVDPAIVAVLDKYQIAMRFLGNDGSSANCKKSNDIADNSKFYCLGFSTTRELLELELDYKRSVFNVYHRTVKPESKNPIQPAVGFYPTVPQYPTGKYPEQEAVVLFGHYGAYDGDASVRSAADQIYPGADSGKMHMNSAFIYELPKGISKFDVSFLFYPNSQQVLDASRKNLTAPVVCVETSGFSWANSRNYYEKVRQSTEDKSLNRCYDEWWGYYN